VDIIANKFFVVGVVMSELNLSKLAVAVCVHDDVEHLGAALSSFKSIEGRFVFVSKIPWHGEAGDWKSASAIAAAQDFEVVQGDWESEHEHRAFAYSYLIEKGFTHALIPDGDEIIEPELLETLKSITKNDFADRVYVEWDTYWKDPYHVIRPREPFTPCILINLSVAKNGINRNFDGGRALLLNGTYGIIHHMSYAGSNERILRKISTWSHKDDLVEGWVERIWNGWDFDNRIGHLHPTHPEAYQFAEHVHLHPVLKEAGYADEIPNAFEPDFDFPTVSIVIPLCGGESDISECLMGLSSCFSLLHEVIVVDNASPDDSAQVAKELLKTLPGGRLIKLDENLGFAKACNKGAQESAGEVVLFLNSDAVLLRPALIRLIESLWRSGTIAASGPLSNNVGHFQRTASTYTSLANLDPFAVDLASSSAEDQDTDMLVGFCLAVRKSAFLEVGPFDEGFGLGLFEDNDLCYRLKRAGYNLTISGKSFVHHGGSSTLVRVIPNPEHLLRANQSRYLRKWADDLDMGFSTSLSGLSANRIQFDPKRKPEKRISAVQKQARQADISLCMIVKNEERVLADCLRSAKPFFKEIIVCDTGSTDRTVEIARGLGATVIEHQWEDSFSTARNQSMAGATGKWICWIDADDTLPFSSGESIIQAVISAPSDVAGFVVPVRFTDEGPHGGVQVDHVKVFRNLPGVAFEGRIHEQIIASLKASAGPDCKIARLDAHVLHSGYDTSEEGQAKKRERDLKLLMLDLKDRPNHPFVLFNLGMTFHYIDRHKDAIKWLKMCLKFSTEAESHVRKAYALLAISYLRTGNTGDAYKSLATALKEYPDDPEIHFHLGRWHGENGKLDDSQKHYLACLSADISGHYSSIDRAIVGYKTMHNLAGVENQRGDYDSARHWYLKAVEAAPEFRPSAFCLFDIAKERGDLHTARQMINFIESQEGRSESWQKMRESLFLS
jgi:GT2 family glycosyltransferase/Tfp pilus assembly protein PilF